MTGEVEVLWKMNSISGSLQTDSSSESVNLDDTGRMSFGLATRLS